MKEIKQEWCENFIKATFRRIHQNVGPTGGIYDQLFWAEAEKAGLWERGGSQSPMSEALAKLTRVELVRGADGNVAYAAFKLKDNVEA